MKHFIVDHKVVEFLSMPFMILFELVLTIQTLLSVFKVLLY